MEKNEEEFSSPLLESLIKRYRDDPTANATQHGRSRNKLVLSTQPFVLSRQVAA